MGKWVDVQQGQTLLNLAFENRIYRWETIWEHAENASLRAARANPQVLAPGDRIYIPSLAELQKQEVVATGAAHVFKLQVVPSFLTLYVLDEQGQPHAGRRYKLTAGGRTFEGSIPADGCVSHEVPPNTAEGELTFWRSDDPDDSHTWQIKVGYLNPVSAISGAKGRLKNLGLLEGEVNDAMDDETRDALRTFQRMMGLPAAGGELDGPTMDALTAIHNGF